MLFTPQPPNGEGRGTILFVDDEPLSLKYFKASVSPYAKVLTASSPEAALNILASEGDSISVVVSDERMPRESGVLFLSHVRKSWPSAVRILTSAYANFENLQQAINGAAIYRFVPKPWDLDELCTAMKEALMAERLQEKISEPVLERRGAGEIENANLELLAVLARELSAPLSSLDTEALQLATLTGTRAVTPAQTAPSQSATWSAQLRLGQIALAAAQVQRDVEYCKSLAGSIGELAGNLAGEAVTETPSMAETVAGVLEHIGHRQSDQMVITLDARRDFLYRAPRQIMNFVLTNLLQSTLRLIPSGVPSDVFVQLAPGGDGNEVRITSRTTPIEGHDLSPTRKAEFERVNRCALWAFGAELDFVSGEDLGTRTILLRFPKAKLDGDVSPSH